MANVKYVIKHNPYIKLNKIEICPNCIEPTNRIIDKKQRSKLREKLGVPSERILFVYGGNLGRPQGIPFLIECLKKLKKNKKVFFLIIGDGTEYKSLNDFVKKEKPNNVKLMQILPKDEYENIILAADVGMIFLDSRFKIPNFPSRLLSYMDAGIPVLSVTDENTDIGDVIEKGKFGWKCLSENSGDVVKKIAEIANMDNINAYGKNARKYLKEYYSTDCAYNVISKHIC